jgi:ABC-type amino acid transport substrate-binding protein
MASRTGVCENVGRCPNVYTRKHFVIPKDKDFVCPDCGFKLKEVPQERGGMRFPGVIVVFALALAGVVALSIFGYRKYLSGVGPTNPTASPSPTVSPTPADGVVAQRDDCKGMPTHKNVWADIQRRGYLVMGVQASAPPMNDSLDRDKWDEGHGPEDEDARREKELYWKRTGFDYDLARMLVTHMGLIHKGSVKAREVSKFKDLFCMLNRQEKDGNFSADIIMSGIARDPSYDETISWSRPYAEFGYALVTKKSSYIDTLDDCKNKKIGIVQGDNIVKAYVNKQLPDSEIVELSDESDEWLSDALNLNQNQVDAVVYDYPFAVVEVKGINDQAKEQGALGKLLEIRIASLPNSELKYSIGVPKGEDDLLALVNDAIGQVANEDNPSYAALIQKYFRSGDITPVKITSQENLYIVQRGDSLSKIAAKVLNDGRRWKELAARNNIGNNYLIVPGQKIIMPNK